MDIIISTLSSLIKFIQLTEDISKFKHFLIDELTNTLTLIQKSFSQHNQPHSPSHFSCDNNNISYNKYDKYISKAKSIITKYQQSIHSNPSITDRIEHTVDHPHLSSVRNNNLSPYQHKNETAHQHLSSLIDINDNQSNYKKDYNKYKPHMKKGIPSNKRRELILSLNNIDTMLTNTSISNNKHCNNSNNNNNTKITNEHIRQKSTELSELFTYINSNEKLNSRLEKVFGSEYVHNIINSDINDNYIDKVRNEAKLFLNHHHNNNNNKPKSTTQYKQTPLSPYIKPHNITKSFPKKSYADELLNTTNALRKSQSIIHNINTSKHYSSKSNTNILPTHHKSKTEMNTFRSSKLNKTSFTIKAKVHAK